MMAEADIAAAAWVIAQAKAGLVLAAPRDASCYSYPRSHAGAKYHAVTGTGQARCSCALLVLGMARPPGEVDRVMLCRRPACSAAFGAAP